MRSLNEVTLEGNLGADPVARTAKSGATWCTFALATNRARKEGNQWVEETQWHEVKAFGREAERAVGFKKGSAVRVTGRLEYEKWSDEHGQARKSPRIVCESVALVPRPQAESGAEVEAIA